MQTMTILKAKPFISCIKPSLAALKNVIIHAIQPLFKTSAFNSFLRRTMPTGKSKNRRFASRMHVPPWDSVLLPFIGQCSTWFSGSQG